MGGSDVRGCHELLGETDSIRHIRELVDQVAASSCPVLIEGESGTGKELVARRLHAQSPRAAKPFIPVNCAGVGEGVFESQFFGHVKGAFTGAEQHMKGLVRTAHQGTLFLDEISEIPPRMQAKLLRVLQEGEVLPVGTAQPERVDTRFIAATNRDLRQEVESGQFRKDLYYRLNIVRIQIPPLRERRDDIEPLLRHFLCSLAKRYNRPAAVISASLLRQLATYPWPGNVRELAGFAERIYAMGMAPEAVFQGILDEASPGPEPSGDRRIASLAEAECWAIRRALAHSRNVDEAARLLQIHRSTLFRKLRRHGIP